MPPASVFNPFAGQYYTQTRWLHRTQHNEREVVQATVAYQLDLGRCSVRTA